MKRAIKSRFKCSREDLNRLFACNRISALVWNKILYLQREGFRSKGDLQKSLKGLYPINSQSVQAVTDKYCAACLATKSARNNGLKNKYPWRRKRNFPTTWKADSFKLLGNRLKLSLGMFAGKRQKPIEVKLPVSTIESIRHIRVQQISLIWDGWLKLAIVIDDGKENAPAVQSDVSCGIDLGEIHSIAGFESEGNAIIITGRLLRSYESFCRQSGRCATEKASSNREPKVIAVEFRQAYGISEVQIVVGRNFDRKNKRGVLNADLSTMRATTQMQQSKLSVQLRLRGTQRYTRREKHIKFGFKR